MSRFTLCFATAANEQRAAYIPFLMLGDPTPEESLRMIDAVIDSGIDALELGIPFSDPIADGPIVSQAAFRASHHQLVMDDYFRLIATIRTKHPHLPIGILVYANIVFHYGTDIFYQQASMSGIDAVLIPDLPAIEAKPYTTAAKQAGISPVLLATPACQANDLHAVAQHSKDFTYLVTRPGVTGIDKACEFKNTQMMVQQLASLGAAPCVFGFGIKNAQDVTLAYQAGAKGVIIGSALIAGIQQMQLAHSATYHNIRTLTRSLFFDIAIS